MIYVYSSINQGEQQKVEIPDVTDKDVSDAVMILEYYGFNVFTEGISDYSGVPENYVILTAPGAGEKVAVGTDVFVYYSEG